MTSQNQVIRFEVDGPHGLRPMTLDPDDFHTMPDAQTLHVYFENKELGKSAGVWTTTPMQASFGPYPGDEFIFVVDGHFAMMDTVDSSGTNVACKKGQSVIFRNGVPVSWKLYDTLKKFYITYLDPRAATPQGLSADGGIRAFDPDLTLDGVEFLPDTSTPQRDKVFFTNDHGYFEVGLWDAQGLDTELSPFPWHEFAQVSEGEDGIAQKFTKGDVFFVPAGTVCK